MLFTDGKASDCKPADCSASTEVAAAKAAGINIITVGVGSNYDPEGIKHIASVPENVYSSSFNDLQKLQQGDVSFKLRYLVCHL